MCRIHLSVLGLFVVSLFFGCSRSEPLAGHATFDTSHPIYDAVAKDDVKTVDRLLTKEPGLVRATYHEGGIPSSDEGCTLLHLAVKNKAKDSAHSLVDNGADPNLPRGAAGPTPLQEAAMIGDVPVIEILVSHGGDLTKKTPADASVLQLATLYGNKEAAWFFLGKGVLWDVWSAASLGDLEMLKKLLADDPTLIDAPGEYGNHPLHYASAKGQLECARWLAKVGANVNAENDSPYKSFEHWAAFGHHGETPLLLAVQRQDLPMVQFLIESGADVNHPGRGIAPLHAASGQQNRQLVETLLRAGADPKLRSWYDGSTALHAASGGLDPEVVEVLLAGYPDVNAVYSDERNPNAAKVRRTPLDDAEAASRDPNADQARAAKVIALLKERGAKRGDELPTSKLPGEAN